MNSSKDDIESLKLGAEYESLNLLNIQRTSTDTRTSMCSTNLRGIFSILISPKLYQDKGMSALLRSRKLGVILSSLNDAVLQKR